MHAGDRYLAGVVPETAQGTQSLAGRHQRRRREAGGTDSPGRSARSRAWAALAWAAGAAALFALFLRISLTVADSPSSDPANNALQAWDMLHGHLLLHGWIVGDVTFYTFELPLMAVVEVFLGLHTITVHVTEALVYLIVAGCAVAIAVTNSRGVSRAARAGVVVAVLAAPALVASDAWIPLGFPDHIGTSVFLLVSCLLIDRGPRVRYAAPLLCLVLVAGQISDVTVRYVAVPTIMVVCAYRVAAARKIKTDDAANLVAAVASVPASLAIRALIRHFGGYLMDSPRTRLAPVSQWPRNGAFAWHSVRMLFGAIAAPAGGSAGKTAIFGFACLIVAVIGMARVVWRWRTARRAEQLLLVAIIVNIGAYTISMLPGPETPHDIAAVLPAGAILGARALVPDRIAARRMALAAGGAAAVAALLPLSLAAAQPPQVLPWAGLTAWLQSHGLHYGLGGYWDGSSVTLQSGGQVQVRTVEVMSGQIRPDPWETNTLWFDPARHYANFVIIDLIYHDLGPNAERFFGKPESTNRLGRWEVLIYGHNLLQQVKPPVLPPVS
jgi:hypothetical protein